MSTASRERHVDSHELLFSSTDRRGVIKSANSVFARVSRYRPEELAGAPHSLVRHPHMPAGAFRLLWDRLLEGRPAAAYVLNRAKDGATYRLFSTVTPLGQDYLSVRMAPMGPLVSTVDRIYSRVRRMEDDLLERRLPRPQVAVAGAREIERHLADLGFADYDEFMLAALPAEVAARGSSFGTAFARPHAGGHLAEVLIGAGWLHTGLDALVDRLETYQGLTVELGHAIPAVVGQATSLQRAVAAARVASTEVADTSPVLLNVATVMAPLMAGAVNALDHLAPELSSLRHQVADLGFRIGLARVHTEMVGVFAAEAVDGRAPERSLVEIPRLCDAVEVDICAMARAIEQANDSLTTVVHRIEEAAQLVREFRVFLGQWRIIVLRRREVAAVAAHLGPIDAQLDATSDQLAYLERLGAQCANAVAPFGRDGIEPHLRRIRVGVSYTPPASRSPLPSFSLRPAHATSGAPSPGPMPIWPGERS